MPRVTLLTDFVTAFSVHYTGEELETDEETARRLVSSGQAIPVPESRETMMTTPTEKRGKQRR